MARYFEEKIKQNPALELLSPRLSLNVCFRYNPTNKPDINDFNLKLRNNLIKRGKSMINYGYMGNEVAIRFVIANPEVERKDIDILVKNILEEAHKLDT